MGPAAILVYFPLLPIIGATFTLRPSWAVLEAAKNAFWFWLLTTISLDHAKIFNHFGDESALIMKGCRNILIEILVYPVCYKNL